MSTKKLNTMIKRAMLELLKEQPKDQKEQPKDKKDKRITKVDIVGAVGRGQFNRDVASVGVRAKNEPNELLNDLGVKRQEGNTDIEKAFSIIEQAIENNEVMAEAYRMPELKEIEDNQIFTVPIKSKDLDKRSALKYIHLTLWAAENARVLQLKDEISFIPIQETDTPTIIPKKMRKK